MSETSTIKPSALIIDDELQIRRLLRVNLEANGYRVVEAATGQEGITQAAQWRPEVVVLDLGCPTWTASRCSSGCASGAGCR